VSSSPTRLLLRTTAMAKGGEGLARDDSGRVVFVRGALPGELVSVTIDEQRKDFARGHVVDVLEPHELRVSPPCPHVAEGCGGCDLQHAAPELQRALKVDVVLDALRRIGRVAEPPTPRVVALGERAYRTTLRAVVAREADSRVALRQRSSHAAVPIDDCLVLHPLLVELVDTLRAPGALEVTLRCGARTGERLVLADPADSALHGLPADVRVGPDAVFHEEVAGVRFRVSARSFFQARPDGADALVVAVREALGEALSSNATLLDAYSGVGLFSATLGRDAGRVIAVEQSASSIADARHNLRSLDATIVASEVERWGPEPVDVIVADPARAGLGKAGAAALAATGAPRLALVSCDPAAFARDTALLRDLGYGLASLCVVDLFGHTSHVEVVSRFDRVF
jgi:23S rRNA (uracil1939-C5)-methyltransferase